jgi:aminopeptidase
MTPPMLKGQLFSPPSDVDARLRQYGELAVRVGLNLRAGQRLLIIGPLANGGVSLEAAPLVRHIAAAGYQAGASLVETIWGDEALQMVRFKYAARDSFGEFSSWLPKALFEHAEAGHALISVYANDPDQLTDEPPELVSAVQQSVSKHVRPFRELVSRNQTNWCVVAAAGEGWAARVFPDLPPDERVLRLWEAIGRLVRLDRPDPVAAWEDHLASLARRRDFLNAKRYSSLKYKGPGTDLTIDCRRHLWGGDRAARIAFAPNSDRRSTTMPPARVDGVVQPSPLITARRSPEFHRDVRRKAVGYRRARRGRAAARGYRTGAGRSRAGPRPPQLTRRCSRTVVLQHLV